MSTMAEVVRSVLMTSDPQPPSLPSQSERTFPTLTREQIARVAACGRRRAVERGEVLVKAGQEHYPFFLVVDGQIEIISSSAMRERLVSTEGPGQFTGEVNMLTGRERLHQDRPRSVARRSGIVVAGALTASAGNQPSGRLRRRRRARRKHQTRRVGGRRR